MAAVDGDDVVGIFLDERDGDVARRLDGDAVGDGAHLVQVAYVALVDRLLHRRSAGGLYAVDLHLGAQRLDGECDARYKASAADGHYHSLHIGQLLYDFQADRALTGDYLLVVKWVYKCVTVLVLQLDSLGVCVVVHARHQAYLGAVAFGRLHL